MGVFVFAIADNEQIPIGLNYALTSTGLRIVVLLPHFENELLFDPDLSILVSDEDASRMAKKGHKLRYMLAGILCGAALLIVVISIAVLYVYLRRRPGSVLFHARTKSTRNEQISPAYV
jgi:hypothetical protein